MLVRLFFLGFALATSSSNPMQAQHLHRHGNHYDVHQNVPHQHDLSGHMVDSWGHHINGDGRHTGSVGVYENGSTYSSYPNYLSYPNYPTYQTPTYISPAYSSYPSSGTIISSGGTVIQPNPIVSGTTIISAPPPNTVSMTSLKPSLTPNSLPYKGRGVKLILPQDVGGEVTYQLDGKQEAMIQSGQEQLLANKGSYIISFSRGESDDGRDFGNARYSLIEGTYRFAVTEKGWDLLKERDVDSTQVVSIPSAKKNKLPPAKSPPLSAPTTVPIDPTSPPSAPNTSLGVPESIEQPK